MPPNKGGNAKKEAGRAKKAENEEKKKDVERKAKEAKEAESWKDGAKGTSKADAEAAKKAELARKKAERDALLAAEEAGAPSKARAAPKAGAKKGKAGSSSAGGGILAPGGVIASFSTNDPLGLRRAKGPDGEDLPTEEISAVGLDQMLEALEVVNQKTDKQSMGAKAGLIEQHPERRFKAAFEAYLEREMPILKQDHPGLRQNQMRDILFKQFQKAPENPFNQAKVAYNATKEEKVEALKQIMDAREAKYKVEQ